MGLEVILFEFLTTRRLLKGVNSFLHRYLGTWRIYAMFHVFHKVYRTDLI